MIEGSYFNGYREFLKIIKKETVTEKSAKCMYRELQKETRCLKHIGLVII